jgi:hypothetical protein
LQRSEVRGRPGGRASGGYAGPTAGPAWSGREVAAGGIRGLRARPPASGHSGCTMALRAEGAALDCFEVTLKCEEGEDDEEAVVVAVIPRPEPMLRGEDGRGTPPLPYHGSGLGPPPAGAWATPAPRVWGRGTPSPCDLRPGRALAPPPPGFGIPGLPEFPSPTPAQGLETSIHAPRATDLPVPGRPLARAQLGCRIPRGAGCPLPPSLPRPGCVLGRGAARPLGPRLGALRFGGWRQAPLSTSNRRI